MFADATVDLPIGVGTSSPVDVAPVPQWLLAGIAGVAPELVAGLSRRAGADAVTVKVAEGQRDKR